ncbi:hypothetical protein GCM10010320_20790 [Streptomyces caelestis]|nr:hypothetical protein GCM10010320_20790 [Streptomyces caelestis]
MGAVRVAQAMRGEPSGAGQPAGVGPALGVAATDRDAGPGLAEQRDRAGLLRCLLRVPPGGDRREQPGGEAVAAPVGGVLRRGAAADEVQLDDGEFDAGAGVLPYAFGVIEDVGYGAGGDTRASGDVHQPGTGVSAGAGGVLAVEDVALAVAGARRRFRTCDVVSDQGR